MPQCVIHGVEMSYRPPGISKKSGKPYSASYRCGFQGCPSVEWIKDAAPPPIVEPATNVWVGPTTPVVRPATAPPNRDRLIFAQTAVKAACELCSNPVEATEMAEKFYDAFVRVEQGQPLRFGPMAPDPAFRRPGEPGREGPRLTPDQAQTSATVPGHFPPDPDEDINF